MPGTRHRSLPRARPAVRAFAPADVPRLVDLWTRAYAGYAGPVVQTPESWCWRVLARPGVGPDAVLVADDPEGEVVGYAVVDDAARVLEIAVDSAAPPAAREGAAERLIEALEARCRARGHDSIRFVLPDADDVVQRALRRAGYWGELSQSFAATIADVAALLEALLPARARGLPVGWAPTVRLDVRRGADWPVPRLTTRVALGSAPVVTREAPGADDPPVDCTIALSLETLNCLFNGRSTFDAALAAGEVTVTPADRVPDAAAFLRLVTVGAPWYSSLADDR